MGATGKYAGQHGIVAFYLLLVVGPAGLFCLQGMLVTPMMGKVFVIELAAFGYFFLHFTLFLFQHTSISVCHVPVTSERCIQES